ncbi:metal-dependent hydrolase family protein [Rosistilla oblonga]|uniref:D-hydantoinase/dihydropyrimidinase n=1 Tax=Rosistilla oblonga TaxID=2527990 RepID=A0A518INF3_9BACT|nr:amidohydrolase family protein [Rosistilla oblonga]QDV54616.1 D-hydantoinase/dihydropyrimidinase [Rosistilla oblonga]
MRSIHIILASTAVVLTILAPLARAQQAEEETPSYTLITDVNVFDGVADRLTPGRVLIEGNLIRAVGPNVETPDGAVVIDGGGRTLMPGLINCHVHLALPDAIANVESKLLFADVVLGSQLMARGYLMDGFTTVRDAGGNVFGIKKFIDRGLLPGPRIYPSGALISQLGGHFDLRNLTQHKTESHMERIGNIAICDGVPEVLVAARRNFRLQASQLKICVGGGAASDFDPVDTMQFTADEIRAAVTTANNWHTYVGAHIFTPQAMHIAADNGVMVFDHAFLIDEDAMKKVVEKGIFLVPQMNGLSPELLRNPILGPVNLAKIRTVHGQAGDFVALIKKFKPKIVFADDAFGTEDVVFKQRRYELGYRASLFGNFETLRQATSAAGELMALTGPRNPYSGKLGVIEEGALADMLIVDGNPLDDISVIGGTMEWFDAPPPKPIETIRVIMKDGKIFKNTL